MTPAQKRRRAKMRQAVELRAKGHTLRAIAAHLELSPDTVWRWLRASETATQESDTGRPKSDVRNRTRGGRESVTVPDWIGTLCRDDLPPEEAVEADRPAT